MIEIMLRSYLKEKYFPEVQLHSVSKIQQIFEF